ncbi:transposase family protein [Streptomyces roseoverticillatus]|uniref:transposase family protein n=1 Tax=Streptomyces roseoverticillatus TaxID=66429 RepID=UPI0033DF1351
MTGSCRCGQSSARVHGRYVRRLRDVSVGGVGVVVELCVRRFRCENPVCTAVTFAERVSPGRPGRRPPGGRGRHHGGQGHVAAAGQRPD